MQSAVQILLALAILVSSVGLSLAGLYLVRVRIGVANLQTNHEVGGIYFAVMGTAYGVLLSFFVVAAWNRYQAARATGVQESADLGSIYWLASGLHDAARDEIQNDLRAYTRAVLDVEWAKMANNQESGEAWAASDRLWQDVLALRPADAQTQSLYGDLVGERRQLDRDRRLRLLSAQDQIPDSLWVVLDIGAVLTVFFTFLFGMRRFLPQALMTGTLTALIVLVLLLVYQLDNPYQGFSRIQPVGFNEVAALLGSGAGH